MYYLSKIIEVLQWRKNLSLCPEQLGGIHHRLLQVFYQLSGIHTTGHFYPM